MLKQNSGVKKKLHIIMDIVLMIIVELVGWIFSLNSVSNIIMFFSFSMKWEDCSEVI